VPPAEAIVTVAASAVMLIGRFVLGAAGSTGPRSAVSRTRERRFSSSAWRAGSERRPQRELRSGRQPARARPGSRPRLELVLIVCARQCGIVQAAHAGPRGRHTRPRSARRTQGQVAGTHGQDKVQAGRRPVAASLRTALVDASKLTEL
jgi:hypothetical protein